MTKQQQQKDENSSLKKRDINNNKVDVKNSGDQNNTNTNYHKVSVHHRYGFNRFYGEILTPLGLLTSIPLCTFVIWYICAKCNGNLFVFYNMIKQKSSVYEILYEIILKRFYLTKFAVSVVFSFFAWAIVMTILIPGKSYPGSTTINGNVPMYKDNGFAYHIVTTIAFFVLATYLECIGYSVAVVYDRFDEILVALNVIGLMFCWFLYLKGIFFPSSTDCSTSGNILFDYYWGTELHPRIFGIDVKMITNCRFGMAAWYLLEIIFCWKCFKVNGFVDSIFVSTLLLGLYLTKFFYWESGYMKTIDIALDRAGFYLCFGCICWVPAFYTLPAMYLVNNPVRLGTVLATIIFLCGIISLYLNYDADRQKQVVRATNGNCLIWGRKPNIIEAKYECFDGTKASSILLASGYWGLTRHFHYIPEISLAFCWSVTSLFHSIVPYFYVIFLTLLLIHRSIRDDNKCRKKYGKYWDAYCTRVPNKIIPYIF